MDLEAKLNKYFQKLQQKNTQCPTQVLVFSEKYNINYAYNAENLKQPFHIASIGKMMTATVIGILSDNGLLDINEKIYKYLTDDSTENLFIYKGIDYKEKVTILQLLDHTSGIADYFESRTNAGSNFVNKALGDPNRTWSPRDLLNFTRTYQTANSAAGKFLYSDTGYILLGMIIEKITKMPYQEVLKKYIFSPLSMKDSYLLFGGTPINPKREIAKIWFENTEISKLNMLSCDWAGGGVVSTLSDLLLFQKAFWDGGLVSKNYLTEMTRFRNKFRSGMYYGSGMMQLRFEGFFFLLRGLPRSKGHSGILGTLMFYDELNDLHIIINLGSNKRVVDSIKAIIYIEQHINRTIKANN